MSKEEPARLLLTRHGQTEWHHDNRYAGRTDIRLNETGRQEAESLTVRAAREVPDHIVCSPLVRAVETARPAAEACGVELAVDERLREVDFGEWEGKTLAEIQDSHPEAAERFIKDPDERPFPGGEPLSDAANRGLDALRELDRGHRGEKVLVVAHNTLIRLVLCALMDIPLREYRRRFPRMVNVAINEIRLNEWGGGLYTLNDSEHLQAPVDPTSTKKERS
ncbi:MAG: histidine phosphatase family protein [Rubrobacteraceae bacterium]